VVILFLLLVFCFFVFLSLSDCIITNKPEIVKHFFKKISVFFL